MQPANEPTEPTRTLGGKLCHLATVADCRDDAWLAEASEELGCLVIAHSAAGNAARLSEFSRALHAVLAAPVTPVAGHGNDALRELPDAVRRLVALFRHLHRGWKDTGGGAETGVAALVALVDGDRLFCVHAGGQLGLQRIVNGEAQTIAGPLLGTEPAILGGHRQVRVEVAHTPLRPNDLVMALPDPPEPADAIDALIANLTSWQAQLGKDVLGASEHALGFPPQALPQCFAALSTPVADWVEGATDDENESGAWSELMSVARSTVNDIALSAERQSPNLYQESDAAPSPEPLPPVEEPEPEPPADTAEMFADIDAPELEPPVAPAEPAPTMGSLELEPLDPPAAGAAPGFDFEEPQPPPIDASAEVPAPQSGGPYSEVDDTWALDLEPGADPATPGGDWSVSQVDGETAVFADTETAGAATEVLDEPFDSDFMPKPKSAKPYRPKRRRTKWPLLVAGALSGLVGLFGILYATGAVDALARYFQRTERVFPGLAIPGLMDPVPYAIQTQPTGAALILDGVDTGLTTPIDSLELAPGTHAVELRLAGLGGWSGELVVEPGNKDVHLFHVVLSGSVAARTDKVVPGVEVEIDGAPVGTAPVVVDEVLAGAHIVHFKGPDNFSWQEEILVEVDGTVEVTAPMSGVETLSLVTIRSAVATAAGLSYSAGDRVLVDGIEQGITPAEIYLTRGRHAVEVKRTARATVRRVIDVRPGDRRFIDVRMDRVPALRFHHTLPEAIDSGGPVIAVRVQGQGAKARRKVAMHFELEGRWRRLDTGAVPGTPGSYVVGLPISSAHAGTAVRYYFTTHDPAGQLAYSPIYSAPIR